MIELELPSSGRRGRAFLDRDLLNSNTIAVLERDLAENFVQPEDVVRTQLLERLLGESELVHVSIHPGELSPPEYHVYFRDQQAPETPLFGCILAPLPVISEMLAEPPHILLETATFQAMLGDNTPAAMIAALEDWSRRVWPQMKVPRFDVRPWPVETVPDTIELKTSNLRKVPAGAGADLRMGDYPTSKELSA
jgi:hypothetical protein